MIYQIEIPIGCEGHATQKQFANFCKHFGCELQKKKRGSAYYIITSEDPTKFFWLGMNLNFRHDTNLATSPAVSFGIRQ